MKTLKIIKIGGDIVDNMEVLDTFLKDVSKLKGPKILVHGGGKLASELASNLNIPVSMVEGRRITDLKTLEVATMVYAGKINKTVVTKLQKNKCNAIGLTGADGNVILSQKRPVKLIDYGFVGDIVQVNSDFIHLMINAQLTPVFCAITHNTKGQLLNTNADTIAGELAKSMSSLFNTELYYCFNKPGVLRSVEDDNSVIPQINSESYGILKSQGIISEGMIPKLDNCFNALNNGVNKVFIGKPAMLKQTTNLYTTITK